jgi:hypothetical protein
MPAEAKGDFFVRGAAKLQADCCCDPIGMRDYVQDVYPHVVAWMWIGPFTSLRHDVGDVIIMKECWAAIDRAESSYRFPDWKLEEVGAMNTAHRCCHRIQNMIIGPLKFSNTKVVRTLIETEYRM